MDVSSTIENILSTQWSLSDPSIEKLTFKQMEFDPKSPLLQILLENFPAVSTWVIGGLYKIEHRVRITIYQKLIHYQPNNVETYKNTWFNIKQEINRIIIKNKFVVPSVNNLITGVWTDTLPSIAVGRGIKTTKEPIMWRSEQIVTLVYYENYKLIEE